MNIHKDTKSVDSVKERFLSPSRARMLRRYAANREAAAKKDIQEHDEIIKEAAKAQIAALKEEVQKLHAEAAEKVNQVEVNILNKNSAEYFKNVCEYAVF